MPQPYSDDLRCKLLEAYEAGQGTLRELAKQFRVSWGYSKKIRAQQLRSGQKQRPQQRRHGPSGRVSPEVQRQLRSALRQQPDLTLDGDVFLAFLEQVLAPKLEPGQVVVLDNLGAHKVSEVRPLIESRGAQLLYLPPYSPDFNPIEQAWSKLKQQLRGVKARVVGHLEAAVAHALAAITAENARAFFRHCGYGIQQL